MRHFKTEHFGLIRSGEEAQGKKTIPREPNGYGQGDERGLGLFIEFLS